MTTAGSFETTVQEPTQLSALEEIIAVQTLHLAPKHLGNISAGVKESLASMLLHWSEGLKAVPIVYTKADWNVSENAAILYDNPCVHVDVRVRWLALCPKPGVRCAGTVSNQGPEHLGLLLFNYFNVTIQASQIKSQYHWDDLGKTWMSSKGAVLAPGDKVEFEILDTATDGGVLVIFGSVDKMHQPKDVSTTNGSQKSTEPAGWSVTDKAGRSEKSKKRKSQDEAAEKSIKKIKKAKE
jgi:hypothetical protein